MFQAVKPFIGTLFHSKLFVSYYTQIPIFTANRYSSAKIKRKLYIHKDESWKLTKKQNRFFLLCIQNMLLSAKDEQEPSLNMVSIEFHVYVVKLC